MRERPLGEGDPPVIVGMESPLRKGEGPREFQGRGESESRLTHLGDVVSCSKGQ